MLFNVVVSDQILRSFLFDVKGFSLFFRVNFGALKC